MMGSLAIQVINIILGLTCLFKKASTVGTLTSVPEATNGVLAVCTGDVISLVCTHSNVAAGFSRWTVPGVSQCIVAHDGTEPDPCGEFTFSMVSDTSGPALTSTARATATELLDGTVVVCRAGGLVSSPQVGNITIKILGSPSTPTPGPIEYSVESATTGRVRFSVISVGMFGTAVSYGGSVAGNSGTVQVTDSTITVSGLVYTQTHMVTVTAASCPTIVASSAPISIVFNIAESVLYQPSASIVCSNPSLPIRVSWTVDAGTQTSNEFSVALNPPPTATPTISYSSTGGRSGSTRSDSPYLLTDTVRNDTYTFTVSVTNVAGVSSALSKEVRTSIFEIDDGSVSECLLVNLSLSCFENISNGDFSIKLEYTFGDCRNLLPSEFTMKSQPLSAHSTCVRLRSGSGDLCYQAALMFQSTEIDTKTNLNFASCSIDVLQSFLGAGVSYQLSRSRPSNENNTIAHFVTATLSCNSAIHDLSETPQTTCIDGSWSSTERRSCSIAAWLIVVIIIIVVVICIIGIISGMLICHFRSSYLESLSHKKQRAVFVVILLIPVIGIGIGMLFYYCCCRHHSSKPKSKEKLSTQFQCDLASFYADPNTIEHQTTAIGEEYAMVDVKGRKKKQTQETALYQDPNAIEHQTTAIGEEYAMVDVKGRKKKQTQETALYQDPNAIEHQIAPSGDTYAVVDKPKRKREPDVVPPGSQGLTYADLDVAASRRKPKPAPQHQALDPGRVEYADIY